MCVAALAWHAHPRWRLVAIGNRDEFHERPAAALVRWDDCSGMIAGRDLVGGGTWLGVSEAGRFALITNRRGFGGPDPSRRSRGELIVASVAGDGFPAGLSAYNAFNLLTVAGGELDYTTNRPGPLQARLGHGVFGLSNGALDEPWHKTLALKIALTDWLNSDESDPARLFAALASEDRPAIGLLPDAPSEVSVEPRDTPPFIRGDIYGTRCSTVVTVSSEGAGRIIERRFDCAGGQSGETAIDFAWI